MATSTDLRYRRRLFLVLSAITVITLVVIAVMIFQTRATLVELDLSLSGAELTVLPPADARSRKTAGDVPARTRVDLLDPALRLRKIDVREADRLSALLEERGSVDLRPQVGGAICFEAGAPLEAGLRLFRPTRVTILPAGRDRRSGGAVVKLTLGGTKADSWSGTIPAQPEMRLELRNVEVRAAAAAVTIDRGSEDVSADSPVLELHGGSRRAEIGLFLLPDRGPSTLLRVVDLATGDEASPRSLSFSSTELRTLAFENRLILLEPQPGAMQTLLHPSLKMSDLQLFRPDPVEPESYVLGGRIRFPLGERETVEVAPGALLSLDAREPLTLTSCSLTSGRLEIAVRGKVAHLAMGPTADLHTELLPNLFRWLYTHELRKLIYGILASVLGTSLALLKLFGGFKE
ncbi:MAG TPA: hypothetical protein DD490_14935 [Acidobacteria bacterium]|nr:hypothetical protein [Acidobacteriota bacterium]